MTGSVFHTPDISSEPETFRNGSTIEWAVDQLIVSDGALCAMGWCASEKCQNLDATLQLHFSDGEKLHFPLACHLERRDVTAIKQYLPTNCGFFLYTSISNCTPVIQAIIFAKGNHVQPIQASIPFSGNQTSLRQTRTNTDVLRHYFGRLLIHVRQGNWQLIAQRLRGGLPSLLAPKTPENILSRLLSSLPSKSKLIVDHALGGGANHYRDELIRESVARNITVLLWTFSPITLAFQLEIIGNDRQRSIHKVDVSCWDLLVECEKIESLVFNNGVSYPMPERISPMLTRFTEAYPGKRTLTLMVHDFFMVCPSHFLLNRQGDYCGIPEESICRKCLPEIEDGLAQLFQQKDIVLWRNLWRNALSMANEIITFSGNTRELLLRAYPNLDRQRLVVRPHQINYLNGIYNYPCSDNGPVRVAMVGAISSHKGGDEFVALVREAQRQAIDIEFIVIGTLQVSDKPANIYVTGPYERHELAGHLNKFGVHIALMLSICPETFSYVTHELIGLRVPLLSFALGAQGEAIGRYQLGKTVIKSNAKALLADLIEFKKTLDCYHTTGLSPN